MLFSQKNNSMKTHFVLSAKAVRTSRLFSHLTGPEIHLLLEYAITHAWFVYLVSVYLLCKQFQ